MALHRCSSGSGGGGISLALNRLIPSMTSATSPSGVVTTSSLNGSYPAYTAFDDTNGRGWCTTSYSYNNDWVQYEFPTATVAKAAQIVAASGNGSQNKLCKYKVQASNDSSFANPVTLAEDVEYKSNAASGISVFDNNTAYKYYRFTVYDANFTSTSVGLKCALYD